jgi:class 3 adenylate cyclase
MESHGAPGRIQLTDATYRLLADRFVCEPRGTIEVKGRGPLKTWWLLAER